MPNLLRSGIVSLVLFGLLLVSGGLITGKRLTLGQYTLVALPIVVFYPLLLQLSKYLSVYLAFPLAFVLMGLLVVGNLQRNQGRRFAYTYGVFGLVTVVGLFSLAALLTKGAGTVVTIAVFILVAYVVYAAPKLPARLPRREKPRLVPPPPPTATEAPEAGEAAEPPTTAAPPTPAGRPTPEPPPAHHYCAYCGGAVQETFAFCPGCGKEARVAHQCAHCGADLCDTCSTEYRHCPGCGAKLQGP
jgi:hypothetical protein